MNYNSVTNCQYITEDRLHISCQVTFDKLGTVFFVASSNDIETHGREIYQRASTGEFGAVAEYVPINYELTLEETQVQARQLRNQFLSHIDVIASNPLRWGEINSQDKDNIATYRTELLNVPQQAGFPFNIIWPTIPEIMVKNIKEIIITPDRIFL